MKCCFSDGVNLAGTGALMEGADGTTVRVWAELGGALQDGGAHKSVWHCRGDSRKEKHRKAKHVKCQASDGLSLVVVTAAFGEIVLMKFTLPCTIEGTPRDQGCSDAWV